MQFSSIPGRLLIDPGSRNPDHGTPRQNRKPYKLSILAEVDAAQTRSEIGEIKRREGLYSSLVSEWRKQRERGALEAMSGRRPGRKSDPVSAENARLRERVSTLEGELATASELIEAQGKVSALLQQISRQSAEQK